MTDDEGPEGLLSELDLGPIKGRPRIPRPPLAISYVRDLTRADIASLAAPIKAEVPRTLTRIHASHHSLAKCLAAGMKPQQAALVTGYCGSRISVLQADPAFQALVEDYKSESRSVFADLAERMSDMSLDAMEILQERLQEKPEEFTVPMLLEVVKSFADRTGHGPGQDLNVKVTGEFIDRPPRESYEDWQRRRQQELAAQGPVTGHSSAQPEGLKGLRLVSSLDPEEPDH